MKTKVGMGLAALGLGAAVLTGCGDSDGGDNGGDGGFEGQSADKIVAQAKSDMGDLTSVRVVGGLTSDGQKVELDMQLSTEGECTGTMGFNGGEAELLGTGGSMWMKPDEAFWKSFAGDSAPKIIAAIGDKWVVMPAGNDGAAEFCDLDELLDELIQDDDDTTYSKKETEDVDGEKALAVESTDDDGSSTGYVLVDEPHYLVKVEKTEGDEPGSVTFSEFDEAIDVKAPADDEVIDMNSLAG